MERRPQAVFSRRQWGLVALCLLAFGLRLPPLWADRFHPDEALYASWGLLIRTGRDVWLSSQAADKPPVAFYLMALSFNYLWRCEAAARLPGLLAGTLCVPMGFQVSGFRFREGAWVTAALLTFSPYMVAFSPTAFLDPLMVSFALAAWAAARRGRAGWAGVWLGLSAATKLTGLLFLPLLQIVNCKSRAIRQWHVANRRFWSGLLGVLVLVVIWDRVKGGTPFWVQQAINYEGARIVSLAELLPRLRAWLSFFPYFFGCPALVAIAAMAVIQLAPYVLRFISSRLVPDPQRGGSVTHMGQAGAHNLSVPNRLYSLESSLQAVSPAKASTPERKNSPQRETLARGEWGACRGTFYVSSLKRQAWPLWLGFGLFYLAVHCLLAFQLWDRYLLGLVPVAALLVAHVTTRFVSRVAATSQYATLAPAVLSAGVRNTYSVFRIPYSREAFRIVPHALLIALLLPPALTAAGSGYPIGGDHGAYDGIDHVADYLRAQEEGTVVYDHWLGWEFRYYLWDAPVYVAYFPEPGWLRDDLQLLGKSSPRYVVVPAYVSAQPVLEAVSQAGFEALPVLATNSRRGQATFTVYKIIPGK